METDDCLRCPYHKVVTAAAPKFRFIGCTYPPYRGKWVAEIKCCPQCGSEDKESGNDQKN